MKHVIALLVLLVSVLSSHAVETNAFLLSGSMKLDNGTYQMKRSVDDLQCDQSSLRVDSGVISVTTTNPAVLPVTSATTPYWAWFRNQSSTGDVCVTLTLKLRPSDFALLPLSTTNITYYLSSMGTTNLLDFSVANE